jgi:transcriptional regulator
MRRIDLTIALGVLLAFTAACTNKKSVNPLAGVGSKQPDKVLFDKAMDAMHHNRFDVARLTLQTLINTYPDSEYIARAKLAMGDSWYAEGGTATLAEAEQEYSEFAIFFPNLPEAAEAQLKIANIHYQQMEKTDRDPTHAKRAEDEYRKVILQYPHSKVVPEAKKRLLEVQEVLAHREFGIGRFYYLRESYVASIARLQSLVEKYPLYSRADEGYYLLGQNYEGRIERIRKSPTCDVYMLPRGCMMEADKASAITQLSKSAAEKYSTILTRYPLMDRADDAKKRLEAMHAPVSRHQTKDLTSPYQALSYIAMQYIGAKLFERELKKGSTELLILSLVEHRPRHGYEISKLIEQRSEGLLKFNVASFYPLLYRLEKRGFITGRWVEKEGQRRRRYYQLTGRGKKVLKDQRSCWADFVHAINRITGEEHA